MELEFGRREIAYWKPVLRQMQPQEQTQEVRLTEDMPDAHRILGAWGQVIHRAKEWRGNTVNFDSQNAGRLGTHKQPRAFACSMEM